MTTTIWTPTTEAAAQARAKAKGVSPDQPEGPPMGAARMRDFPLRTGADGTPQFRAELVEWEGQKRYQLDGYASVTERPYKMFDFFGEYDEVVDGAAFDATLAAKPDVAFLLNHAGTTMARTTNKTLTLDADATGLHSRAFLNPARSDVMDLVHAITDRDLTEMSFAFLIDEGEWSPDFATYRIKAVNLDRGDVSAVNYGANPYTSLAARSQQLLQVVDQMPAPLARAAMARLGRRDDMAPAAGPAEPPARPDPEPPAARGRSIALVEAELRLEDDD